MPDNYINKRKKFYSLFRGIGLDVGPFDKPFITEDLAAVARIEYVDLHTPRELKKIFSEIKDFHPVKADYVHNVAESGFDFTNKRYDFIILSHVLEHVMNPFFVVSEAYKKLNPGGVLYIGLPDCRFSDDRGRPRTTYAELRNLYDSDVRAIPDEKVVNYLESPVISKVPWVKAIIEDPKKEFTKAMLDNERVRSFHVHVWNDDTSLAHLVRFMYEQNYGASLVAYDKYENNGYENVFVFKKPGIILRLLKRHVIGLGLA